ncbi:dachshund homolog 1-like [Anarrhichthys ocellatus]|uniref:dachshund homolog 1-like n=1 Tax=Anarrhichthys ocellatus TaxID=433405 RepID=UPI0012EE4867|nr:dachshund homolog 1-like [Anarrhichthys ocellatus]XP_031694521.1 dachshund homolog 1-like [Anarrhichthys ocellatus]
MLTRPLTLKESDDRGRGLAAVTTPPVLPLVDDYEDTQTAPSLPSPPVAPPPCCPCSSLLPRLLSAHRWEVRRLLRGALSSLGRRLDSLERSSRTKRSKKRSRQRGEGGGATCSPGLGASSCSPALSCSPAHRPPVTASPSSSSSSSDGEDSPTPPPLSSSLSQKQRKR